MNNNNVDIANLMNMLSKMSKDELEAGLAKANQILGGNKAKDFLNQIKNGK